VQFIGQGEFRDAVDGIDMVICAFNQTRTAHNRYMRAKNKHFSDLPEPGERLICLKNNYDKKIYNGQIFEVLSAEEADEEFFNLTAQDVITGDVVVCEASKAQLHSRSLPDHESPLTFFDYAYAITCHKSQGSEWDNVAVISEYHREWDMARWRYTAATRAAKKLWWVTR
jgi:exodeoxyribonuclease-5